MAAATAAVSTPKASRSCGMSTDRTAPPNGPRNPPTYRGSVGSTVGLRMRRTKIVATIGPAIAEFAKAHPALSVELSLSNRRVDLVSEGYDLAIRVGDLPSSALVSRRIGTCRLTCCAAPSWLATHHAPATPLDLANGGCIINSNFNPADVWRFMDAGGNAIVAKVAGNLQMDSDVAQRSVAKQGGGIAYLPLDLVRTDIADGSLVQLLKDFGTDSMPIHALYPSRRQLPKRVSGAIEAITTSLRAGEPAMYGMSASSDTSRHFE